jgi:hypothetical protein
MAPPGCWWAWTTLESIWASQSNSPAPSAWYATGLDPGPGPIGLPARKPLVDRLPRPIALGQVPPWRPGTDPEQDAVQHLA